MTTLQHQTTGSQKEIEMEFDERWIMRDRPQRRIDAETSTRARSGYRAREGISPATGIAVGLGVAAIAALAGTAYARRQPEAPRPPDDADRRFREGGHWNDRFAVAGKTVLINRPRAEVYAYWRDLTNQSKFLEDVKAVRAEGKRFNWTFTGLMGGDVEVEVELTEERENQRLAWASVPGSEIETRGSVTFREAPAGRGTYVELDLEYVPPAGAAGRAVSRLFRAAPQQRIRHGLKRLKMLLEAGEVATSAQRKENV